MSSAEKSTEQQSGSKSPADAATGVPAADPAVQELERELQAAQDRALRAQAELENVRRRLQRDLDDALRYANLPLLTDLLPVLDNVSRAIDACDKGGDLAVLVAGVKMVSQQIGAVLDKHHCVQIPAMDQPFDPGVHQAVAQQTVEGRAANTVVAVAQAGFRLHDRVLRPALVVVSSAPTESSEG